MESSAKNCELYFDISETETPDYEQVCPLSLEFDQGETLDTFYTLCSNTANSVKTALDPTWSTSFKFDKSDPVAQFIMDKEFKTGLEATAGVRIINKLKDEQVDFTCTLSGINYSAVTEEVLEVAFDIKVYKASTFLTSAYNPSA